MTLVAAWLRRNHTLQELVIASDSRIRGGEAWDACPKLMPLPRPATLMAMSGDAVEAYTFLIQAMNTCLLLDGNLVGRTDILYLARKLRDVYKDSRGHVTDLASDGRIHVPDLDVVLFGWSWRRLRFEGYSYKYRADGDLWMEPLTRLHSDSAYPLYIFGNAAKEAHRRLLAISKERGLPKPLRGDPHAENVARDAYYDWEPLEALLETIADPAALTVGGPPQVARIYQYGEVETFVWRDGGGRDYFGGRPVPDTERFDRRIMRQVGRSVEVTHSDRSIAFGGANPDAEAHQVE